MFDFEDHLKKQYEWSEKTFGPGFKTYSILDHLEKELKEIKADPVDLTEWIDVIILASDGAMRAGYTPAEVIAALVAKMEVNRNRLWPRWQESDPNKAIEHIR